MANDLSLDLNILSNPTDASLSASDYVVDSGYTEGDAAIGVTGRVVVSSTAAIKTFSAAVSANADDDDVLALSDYGQLVARAFRISYSYDADTSTFTFTPPTSGGVHPGVVSVLFREVLFSNSGTTPMDNTREITFSVSDGTNTSSAVSYVAVTDTNDAPVLTFPDTLSAIDEDGTFTFSALEVSDADGDIVKVTIDATMGGSAAGTFSVTLPAGVTEVSNSAGQIVLQGAPAALTTAFDALSYSAGENQHGDVSFSIAAVEMTTSEGSSIDTPLTATGKTATLTVNSVNDAPVTDATATLTLTSDEDGSGTAATVASVFGAGTSDVDGDTVGVAITGVTIGELNGTPVGTLEYSTDAGANWAQVTLEAGKALLLDASAELRFVPGVENFNTTEQASLAPSISFRAWDGTSGSAGTQVVIASSGSSSAFSSVEGTANVVVTPVNDAPVIDLDSGVAKAGNDFSKTLVEFPDYLLFGDAKATEGYVVPDPLFDTGSGKPTLSDVDSANITKIEIKVTTDGTTAVDGTVETLALGIDGYDVAPLLLDPAGAKATWVAADATLVIEASDTNVSGVIDRAQAEMLIHSVFYANSSANPTDYGSQPTRDIVFTVTDVDANGTNTITATATSTVTITAFDNAPTLTTPDAALEITSAQTATLAGLSISDADSLTATLRVTVDAGPAGSKAAQFSIDDAYTKPAEITFDNTGDELTISVDTAHANFDATTNYVDAINTLLDNVVYTPNLAAEFAALGADTVVTITASTVGDYTDPFSIVDNATGSFSIKVTPSLTTSTVQPATPSFDEDADSGLITVKPAEGFADLEFTSVTDGKLYLANADGTQGAEITLNTRYDLDHASTGGAADSVRVIFVPDTNYNDANGGTAEFTVRSAIGDGDTAPRGTDASFTPTVHQVNDAPVLSFNGNETFPTDPFTLSEDGSVVFSAANSRAITFADVDDGEGAEEPTVTLSVTNGTLTLVDASNVTPTGNGTGTLTVTGTIANINAALDGLTYAPSANFNGSDSISVSVNDNGLGGGAGLTDSGTIALTITAVNDAPVVTLGAQTGAQEDAAFTLTGLDVSDIDSAASDVTVTLTVDEGTLSATGTADVTVSGDSTAALVLTGTAANLSTYLGGNPVSFSAGADFNGDVTLTMKAEDNGATGSGGALSDTKTTTISVAAVNDAPTVVSGQEAQTLAAVDEDTAAPAGATVSSLFSGAFADLLDDQTANTNGGSANTFAGVIITSVPDTTGKGTWEANTGSGWTALSLGTDAGIFLSSSAELRFVPDANWHGTVPSLSASLVESGHGYTDGQVFATLPSTGGTSAVSSGTVTVGSTVNAVNDAVTITPETDTATLAEDDAETALGVSFALSDVDATLDPSGQVKATVSVTGVAADGTTPALALSGVSGIVANVATITGTLSEVQTALNGLNVTPAANFNGTATVNVSVTDDNGTTIASGSGDATSDSSAVTVTVTAVNDAPVVKAGQESVTLTAIDEDASAPAGASVASLVSASLDDTTDGDDADGLFGVYVSGNAATTAEGTWQYQSGSSWVDIGTVSEASPLYLPADTNVRFSPAEHYSGTPGGLTVHLIEGANVTTQTAGTAQIDFGSVFNADIVLSSINSGDNTYSGFDTTGGSYVTSGLAQANSQPADDGLPDDGTFAANSTHPEVVLSGISSGQNAYHLVNGNNGGGEVSVTAGAYSSVHLYGASTSGSATLTVTAKYADGTQDVTTFTMPDWFDDNPLGDGVYYLRNGMDRSYIETDTVPFKPDELRYQDANDPAVFGFAAPVDPTKELSSVAFSINNPSGSAAIFGGVATNQPSDAITAPDLTVDGATGGDTAASSGTVSIGTSVTAVADAPNLADTADLGTNEDTAASFAITTSLVDTDGSETLSVVIEGAPAGAVISDGTLSATSDGVTAIDVTNYNRATLTVTPAANSGDNFTLTVKSTATDSAGEPATSTDTIVVTVAPVADKATLSVTNSTISANEDAQASTSGSISLVDTDGSEAIVEVRFAPTGDPTSYPLPAAYFDGTKLDNGSTFTIDVTDVNDQATTAVGTVTYDGTTVIVSFDATDGVKSVSTDKFSIGFAAEDASGSFNLAVTAVTQEGTDTANRATTDAVNVGVTINAVADTPDLSVSSATVSGAEDTWISLGTISAASVDNDGSETLVVELSGLPEGAELRDDGANTATVGADGKVDVSGWNLAAIDVKPLADASDDFTVTVSATVTEASNGNQASDSKTIAVTVNAVADAPTLTVVNTSISADEGFSASSTSSVALVDNDGSEAIVALRFEPVTEGDTAPTPAVYFDGVQLTDGGIISLPVIDTAGASKTVTGTVSVSGGVVAVNFDAADAVADIVGAVFSFGYVDENANGSFTVKVSAVTQEGADTANQAETTPTDVNVTINAVNDGPAATAPANVSVDEDTAISFTGANALSVSDIDVSESAGNVTVRLSVTNGTLSVTPAAGLDSTDAEHDVDGSDGTLVFTGTVAGVNATLASLSYTGDLNFNTENSGNTETLSFSVEDNGATGSGGELTDSSDVLITVNAVNDAPVLTAPEGGVAATEDTAFAFTGANAISVSDADVAENAGSLTVSLSVNNGTLDIDTTGVSIDSGAADSAAITISGSAAALNTALATLTYTGSANFNDSRGSESLSISVSDGGSFGTGGTLTDTATVAISVAAVNDAPVASADTAATDEDNTTTIDVLANDSDVDTGDTPADEITVSSVTQPGNGGSVSLVDGVVTFDPNGAFEALDAGESDTTSFTYTMTDGEVSKTETVVVTVNGVNDAPIVATNAGITLNEGTTATIGTAALLSTDVDIETLTYTVTTLPTNGTLKVDGVDVALNGTFTQADIDANKVTYVHNGGETTSDSIGFSMSDGTETVSDQSFAITVNAVNDAPTSVAPSAVSVDEDQTFSFTGTNALSVADSDAATNDVTVTLEVQNGVLNVGATEAANVSFVGGDINGTGKLVFSGTVAQVNAALATLTYAGNQNFNTKAGGLTESLVFDVTDNGNSGAGSALSASQKTVAITVNPVNDDPLVTGALDAAAFSEAIGTKSGQAVFLASSGAFTVSDVELADTPAETLNGAVLQVGLSGAVQATDVLAVADRGLVTVSGSVVSYDGTAVANTAGGSGSTALSVTFNADATVAAVAAVLEAVQFDNQSAAPAGLDHSATSRSVSVDFTDGAGGTATTVTGSITVTPVNDAPTATSAVVNYTAGTEDAYDATADSYTVRAFLADKAEQVVSDIDTASVDAGIAITSVDSLNGVFKYKLTASDAFTTIAGVSEDNALVLGPDAIITYEPTTANFNTEHAGFGAADGISYKVWDQSPGTSAISQGEFVDTRKGGVAYNDGEGPFSDDTFSVDALITAVNDAPVWTTPSAEQTLNEDTSLTFSSANGNLLSIADVDSDEDGGSGLLTVTVGATRGNVGVTASGAATVTGNNSGSVTINGTLADVNATLDGLVYTAIGDQNGADSLVLSVNDNGNSSALSSYPQSDTATVNIAITAINDAPVVTTGEEVRALAAIKEDALLDPAYDAPGASVANLVGSAFGDAADAISGGSSANQLAGIAITANAASEATEGVWRYKLATDADWGTGNTNVVPTDMTISTAFVLPADAELRFEPLVNFNSDNVAASTYGLTAYMIDDSAGAVTAGATLDLTTIGSTGGTSAVSSASISIENVVEGVNDIFRFEVADPNLAIDATNIVTNHTAVPGMTDAAVDGALSTGLGDYVDMEFFDVGSATDGLTFDIDMFKGLVLTDPANFADTDTDGNPIYFAGFEGRGVNGAVDSTLINVISFGNTNNNIALAAEIQNFSTFGFGGNNEALITFAINVSQTWDDGSLQAAVIYDPNRQNAEGNAVVLAKLTGFTEEDMALFTTDDFALFA